MVLVLILILLYVIHSRMHTIMISVDNTRRSTDVQFRQLIALAIQVDQLGTAADIQALQLIVIAKQIIQLRASTDVKIRQLISVAFQILQRRTFTDIYIYQLVILTVQGRQHCIAAQVTNHHFKWWFGAPYKGNCLSALKGRSRKPVTGYP